MNRRRFFAAPLALLPIAAIAERAKNLADNRLINLYPERTYTTPNSLSLLENPVILNGGRVYFPAGTWRYEAGAWRRVA